jgi:hypothetical protein
MEFHVKTSTKAAQKILRQFDQFIHTMKKAQDREPDRIIITDKAAMSLLLKGGERYRGIPVIRERDA